MLGAVLSSKALDLLRDTLSEHLNIQLKKFASMNALKLLGVDRLPSGVRTDTVG